MARFYRTHERRGKERKEARKGHTEKEILTLFVEDDLEDVRSKGILDGAVVRPEVLHLSLVHDQGVTQALGRDVLRYLESAFVCGSEREERRCLDLMPARTESELVFN